MHDEQSKIRDLLGLTNMPEDKIRNPIERTPWDIMFLRQAIEMASRSHDSETQCGCIITKDNTILSGGYNGFVRDIDDSVLPNKRPLKYDFMIHAELNAVLNCARQGKSTLGSTAYITTQPCFGCFQMLWQAGIKRIVYTDWSISANYSTDAVYQQIRALMLLINHDEDYGCPPNLMVNFVPKSQIKLEK
jgi:dCMP deaminase